MVVHCTFCDRKYGIFDVKATTDGLIHIPPTPDSDILGSVIHAMYSTAQCALLCATNMF